MIKKITTRKLSVSVIIPMKNAETTILLTLDSIRKQTYPVKEIIIVDNASSDNSIAIVEDYAKKSKIPLILLKRKENRGVGSSYNLGTKKAISDLVVFMHSDSSLETKNEMEKLIRPLQNDSQVIATYSTIVNPENVWKSYNFWQKCLFARTVGQDNPGLHGKFDCFRRNMFLMIGGFNEKNYGENIGVGAEDADLHIRLLKTGKVILSKARVIHLHYLGKNYKLYDWIKSRRLLSRSYGSIIRLQWHDLTFGALMFAIKPTLALLPFIPHLHIIGLVLLIVYSFWYTKRMYISKITLQDPRIIVLPFINVFFVYYETFWMIEGLLFVKKQ